MERAKKIQSAIISGKRDAIPIIQQLDFLSQKNYIGAGAALQIINLNQTLKTIWQSTAVFLGLCCKFFQLGIGVLRDRVR